MQASCMGLQAAGSKFLFLPPNGCEEWLRSTDWAEPIEHECVMIEYEASEELDMHAREHEAAEEIDMYAVGSDAFEVDMFSLMEECDDSEIHVKREPDDALIKREPGDVHIKLEVAQTSQSIWPSNMPALG